MLFNLFKWGFLGVSLLALTLWLNLHNSTVSINIDTYTITTNVIYVILIALAVYIPYKFVKKLLKRVAKKIHTLSYIRNLIRLTNALNQTQLGSSLIKDILQAGINVKDLKLLTAFLKILNNSGAINAKFFVLQNKINKNLLFIYYKALVTDFINRNDIENIKFFCQRGLSLKQNGWFAYNLVLLYVKQDALADLTHYSKIFKTFSFANKEIESKTYCLIHYQIAKNHYVNGNYADASNICNNLIGIHPTFLPAYSLLLNISSIQQNNQFITETLKKLWLNNNNYCAIDLWVKFNTVKNYSTLKQELTTLFGKNPTELDKLLLTALSIELGKYLEASDMLSNIQNDNFIKSLLAIQLAKKEYKIAGINQDINDLSNALVTKNYWWTDIIK